MSTTPIPQSYAPPQGIVPITDPIWTRWLNDVVWQSVGKGLDNSGPQGTFPKLQIDAATFDNSNMVQELLTMNKGLYSNYFSGVSGIIYGFACNVHRSSGTNFVVAAQLNAWAERGVTCGVFGLATTALAQPGSINCGVTGYEPDIAVMDNGNTSVKWGIFPVFKDRFDGAAATTMPLGNNRFNYGATGMIFASQPRSSTGEYCGWNVGIDFSDGWNDQDNPQVWSAAITFEPGQTCTSGGVVWKSITGGNINNLPAGGSAFWVQRTYAGTNNLAVGIDFSSMSIAAMALMASAIRLRSTQIIHFDETGAIGIGFDPGTAQLKFYNQAAVRMALNTTTGLLQLGGSAIGLGGGAAATLGTIGGSGPGTAAQNKWIQIADATGTVYNIPAWI